MSDSRVPLAFALGVILGMVVDTAIDISMDGTPRQWHRQAIAHHAAHFEVNPTTGETTFVWHTPVTPSP